MTRRRSYDAHLGLHTASLTVAALMLLPLGWLLLYAWRLRDRADAVGAFWSAATQQALWNGVTLAACVSAVCLLVALPIAWLTHATDLPGRRFFRAVLNLPLAVPSYVSGFVVVAALGPKGWFQQLLAPLGVERLPEIYGFSGAFVALLFTYPFALIPLQAALSRMNPAQWEAARSLGASPTRAFFTVVLPRLRAAIGAGALLVSLYVISDFGAVSLLRYESLSYVIYVRYKSLFDKDEAIFLALLLAIVAVVFIAIYRLIRGQSEGRGERAGRRWPTIALGRWRWPALIYCGAVLAGGVGLPVVTVGIWLVRGLGQGNEIGNVSGELFNTVTVGVIAALITVAIAVIPALLGRFGGPRASRVIHAATHIGYALPGIVVALSLVFFAIRYAGPFYQTAALLVFAYVVRFLPLAVSVLDDDLGSQSPRLYEAARGLGCRPIAAWFRVVIPSAKMALAAGLLIVFMSVIKELPTTLLLSPLDFSTLATRIWALTEEAFFTAAALPVLLLLVLAGLALWFRPDVELRTRRQREGENH